MKKFLSKTILFLFLIVSITGGIIIFLNKLIDHGKYFSIKKDTEYIIVGHSHPECAFNDSLINHFSNFAQSGESYFYTYYKTKKIIDNNPQVKVVFIEYTNNQVKKDMDDWIWDEKHISAKYAKYASFMSLKDKMLLAKKNHESLLNGEAVALKKNISFLAVNRKNFIKFTNWGGYKNLEANKIDSLIAALPKNKVVHQDTIISEQNISALKKTIAYCKSKGVQVFLVRSPIDANYPGFDNEQIYQITRKKEFGEIPYLDFKNYPIQRFEFADLEHLNNKGATELSTFFNTLISGGLLEKNNAQEIIDAAIEKRRIERLNH